MPLIGSTGYAPAPAPSLAAPPPYILSLLQQQGLADAAGNIDPRYRWNPETMSLEQNVSGGGSYSYAGVPDPSMGTNVVMGDGSVQNFAQGVTPYTFLSAGENYPGGYATVAEGSPEYNALRDDARTRNQQGIARIAALVGGGAALANTPWGQTVPGSNTGTSTVSSSFANAGAAADGLTPISTGASFLPGGNAAVQSASLFGIPGAASAAGGGLLGSLGLGGWLTLGSLGAQALQGNKDITTNSTNAPPAYIQPYLADAAARSADLYGQGNYVAPVTQTAIDYGTNVLGGSYLNNNPYLDETFKRASGAVTNAVQSNFALSGRNARGIDAAGFAQEGYNDLANQIYGGNYQAERQRMQQMVPYAGMLGAYTNPGSALDDYIARLRNVSGGYGTSTSSTPTQSNWLNGLAGLGLAMMGG